MRKLRTCFGYFVLLFALLSSSCEYIHQPVREYLEYWSSTCQVGKIEYLSPNNELDGQPNLSIRSPIEINLYLVNPKGYEILKKPGNAYCFIMKNEAGETNFYTDYSETALEHNTTIKIQAQLIDDTEGQTITLTGCIWPENRSSLGFSEADLQESFPELFYTTTFVQNTSPDNVKNMNTSGTGEFYSGTNKHYLSFTIPDLSLKRNHGSRYEIKTYLRESDGKLYYTGSETITLDDSDPGNRTYLYYYAEQEDSLFYEYTVQVLGPRGLTSEILATDERLGVHQLTEPTITILNELNGLEDEQGYKCIEVASNDGTVSYTAAAADPADTLTVKVDGVEVTDGNFTVSGIGQHTIEAISSKDGSRPQSVIKKIRIVKTPDPATFTFATDENTYFNGFTDTNGNEYLEVPTSTSTAGYTISPTEEGTTVSGTVDGNAYSAPIDNGTLTAGQSHTLVATIHKQYCNDVTTTRKIMVAKQLEEPVFQFNTNGLSGNTINGFQTIEVPTLTSTESYKIKPAAADSGARISSAEGSSITFSATTEKTGQLGINEYTIKVTVSKNYMRSKTFTKKIKVVRQLQEPTYIFTPGLTGTKVSNFEWIEVPDGTTPVNYTITAETGCTLEIASSSSLGNSSTTVNTNTHNDNLASLSTENSRDYTLTITVKKPNYNSQPFYKKIKVIKELQEPTIKFYTDSSCSTLASSHTNPENSSYRSPYVSYDINLADDGTGYLYYTTTSPDGATVKITDVQNSPDTVLNGKLAIGPHKLLIEVSKTNYKTKTFSDSVKPVYVQGVLKPIKVEYSEKKSGNTQVWTTIADTGSLQDLQFSYISYDKMPIRVSAGNTGNNLNVAVYLAGGSCVASGNTTTTYTCNLEHNYSAYTITVGQSRTYCKTSTQESRTITAKIKPVTLKYKANTYGELAVWLTGLDANAGNKISIRGGIKVNGAEIFHYKNSSFDNVEMGTWAILKDGDFSFEKTFTEPTDQITVMLFDKFRRDKSGSDKHIIDGDETISRATSLSNVRNGWNREHGQNGSESDAGTSWTFICNTISNRDGKVRPRVRFSASD